MVVSEPMQVGSRNGLQAGDRCRPQSRFIVCGSYRNWMASRVLLLQYPIAVAHTLAESQSMLCWCFWMWTAMPFCMSPVFIAYLCSIILCLMLLLVSPMYLISVTAWNSIDNFFLLLHWGLHFHLRWHVLEGVLGFKDGFDTQRGADSPASH